MALKIASLKLPRNTIWDPPTLTDAYELGLPHGDARGFIHHLEKDEKVYIVAAKIHVRGLRLERVWRFTDWGLSGRLIGAFRCSLITSLMW